MTGTDRPEVYVVELELVAEENDWKTDETCRYYRCPNCGESVYEWLDCPECLWYDESAWQRTLSDTFRPQDNTLANFGGSA